MPDITIQWDTVNNRGDWVVQAGSLETGNDLTTAILVSLFTDRVLPLSESPPDRTQNRRGWWGDSYEASPIGSRLWTLYRAKKTDAAKTLQQARDMCREALQWLLDDKVAAKLDIDTQWLSDVQLGIRIKVTKPDGTVGVFQFDWAWPI